MPVLAVPGSSLRDGAPREGGHTPTPRGPDIRTPRLTVGPEKVLEPRDVYVGLGPLSGLRGVGTGSFTEGEATEWSPSVPNSPPK